jgi:hypothetical protein
MAIRSLVALVSALGLSASAFAADLYPWRNHQAPFDFVFGNEIDMHQQTRQTRDGSLFGFFYVRYTGAVTKDRYRVATHADCNMHPDCTAGWTLNGKPASAVFLYHAAPDHPIYLVNRQDIPQPGAHSHFHPIGMHPSQGQTVSGYLLQLAAVDRFCFVHHDAQAAAPQKTCREAGGIAVEPGTDIATHLNIVTSPPPGM